MFEKLLYPTDFSDVSKKAMDFIKQLKGAGTKEVVVFHVIDERIINRIQHHSEAGINAEELEKKMEEHAQEQISAIEGELKKSGFDVKTRIDKGVPFREILKAEQEEEDISVVVIGSHGVSCIEEMFLGSCSEKVIRKSSKPVLVVRR